MKNLLKLCVHNKQPDSKLNNKTNNKTNHKRFYTNTVTQMRVPIFSAPRRTKNKKNKLIIKNTWGQAEIIGNLNCYHRDIIDCIFSIGRVFITDEGHVWCIFELQQLLKKINRSKYDHAYVKEKLQDLLTSQLIVKTDKVTIHTTIIYEFGYTDRIKIKGKNTKYYVVKFTNRYIEFYKQDIIVCYNDIIDQLMAVKNPTIRTLIRFMISHQSHSTTIENVLKYINAIDDTTSRRNKNKKIQEVIKHKEILAKFCIYINEKFKTISHNNKDLSSVYFKSPLKITSLDQKSIENQKLG
jgi:hypothetical protein